MPYKRPCLVLFEIFHIFDNSISFLFLFIFYIKKIVGDQEICILDISYKWNYKVLDITNTSRILSFPIEFKHLVVLNLIFFEKDNTILILMVNIAKYLNIAKHLNLIGNQI